MARRTLRRFVGRLLAPVVMLSIRPARPPSRLLLAPQDIRVADPTAANDIYAGHFALAGRIVNAHGRSPFELEPPSRRWAEALHGFGWLRHLRAADTALARANARALVDDWMTSSRRSRNSDAWRPAVVARRLLSWLSQSPIILEGADAAFYRRLMRSLSQQAAFLQRRLATDLTGDTRLLAALALAAYGLCTERNIAGRRTSAHFIEELERQILSDGGHVSRDPQILVDLLLDLLPLRQAYAARSAEVPPQLLNAIDRMLPMLRLFRHADGSLAMFNGMGATRPEALATILAYDDASAMPLSNAPYSGYQRLAAADSIVICDSGAPPPLDFSARAHAGTLSFEFSTAGQPVIVNCGHPEGDDRQMLQAARSTAAHSTLILNDTSSARPVPADRRGAGQDGALIAGPSRVTTEHGEQDGAAVLSMSHDGYAAAGFTHQRRLALADDGRSLGGEDVLVPDGAAPDLPFVLRFHLHPTIHPIYADDGRSVLLPLARGGTWRLEAGGLDLMIEESIWFGSPGGVRRTEQVVVHGSTGATPRVAWTLAAIAEG